MNSDEPETSRSPILEEVWHRFAVYDLNAFRLRRGFLNLRGWITAVGVLATSFAVTETVLSEALAKNELFYLRQLLHVLVVATPITGSALLAGASRLGSGMNWVLLRGSAETLKREVYRYRTRVGPYGGDDRDEKLAAKLESVTRRLMSSDVTLGSLTPYKGEDLPPRDAVARGEDGFSDLSAETYLEVRLRDQLVYFRENARRLERRHRVLQWSIAALGGLGTLLAAFSLEIWVPVCISLAAAFGSYLELRRVEPWLAVYSRSAMELENIASWWKLLSPERQGSGWYRDQLVNRTEAVLRTENTDWQKEMEDALEALDKGEDK